MDLGPVREISERDLHDVAHLAPTSGVQRSIIMRNDPKHPDTKID